MDKTLDGITEVFIVLGIVALILWGVAWLTILPILGILALFGLL